MRKPRKPRVTKEAAAVAAAAAAQPKRVQAVLTFLQLPTTSFDLKFTCVCTFNLLFLVLLLLCIIDVLVYEVSGKGVRVKVIYINLTAKLLYSLMLAYRRLTPTLPLIEASASLM